MSLIEMQVMARTMKAIAKPGVLSPAVVTAGFGG